MKLTKQENPFMAIVFCRTKRRVDKLEEALFKAGYNCNRLHGGMTQSQREKVMKAFKASEIQYLIATDVAARGLDISGVSHVYNYDIPENAEAIFTELVVQDVLATRYNLFVCSRKRQINT